MTNYVKTLLNLSPSQRKAIANAVSSKSAVTLRFSHAKLTSGKEPFMVSPSQAAKINKAINNGTGCQLTFRKSHWHSNQRAGFLPAILAALVSSLAPVLFNKIFPDKQEGHGFDPSGEDGEGGEGIMLPGAEGLPNTIQPDNGGDVSYHVTGRGFNLPGELSYPKTNKKKLTKGQGVNSQPFKYLT